MFEPLERGGGGGGGGGEGGRGEGGLQDGADVLGTDTQCCSIPCDQISSPHQKCYMTQYVVFGFS